MPIASFFGNAEFRYTHWENHGDDFGITDDGDYQAAAREFLNADRSIHTDIQECTRADTGEVIRFNAVTDEFAIMSSSGIIKTYYKPMPRSLAPPSYPRHKFTHRFATNQLYFEDNCT